MTLRIGFETSEPPTGTVDRGDGTLVSFAGWLDLMHVISGLVAAAHPDDPSVASADKAEAGR